MRASGDSPSGMFSSPPGYGKRVPAAPVSPARLAGRRMRAVTFGVVSLSLGAAFTAFFGGVAAVMFARHGVANPRVVLAAALGAYMVVQGVAHLLRPLVGLGEDVLEIRTSALRRPQVVAPWDVTWRAGATYVGRYLSFRAEGGKPQRLSLWMLTRRDQRALFAWLDAHHVRGGRAAGTAPRA